MNSLWALLCTSSPPNHISKSSYQGIHYYFKQLVEFCYSDVTVNLALIIEFKFCWSLWPCA